MLSRAVKVAVTAIVVVILSAVAVSALSTSSGRSRAPAVALRSEPTTTEPEVQTQVCPPLCGEEPTTTTTTAPAPPPGPVEPVEPAPVVQEPAADPAPPAAVQGSVSQAWLDQLAQCESGGVNGWRTGLFGIEANGVRVGDLSYADQVAWVERILAETGPSAWGCYTNGVVPAPY